MKRESGLLTKEAKSADGVPVTQRAKPGTECPGTGKVNRHLNSKRNTSDSGDHLTDSTDVLLMTLSKVKFAGLLPLSVLLQSVVQWAVGNQSHRREPGERIIWRGQARLSAVNTAYTARGLLRMQEHRRSANNDWSKGLIPAASRRRPCVL